MDVFRVDLSPALVAFVRERIARFESEAEPHCVWLSPYVKRHNILPLFSGWVETHGITPEGLVRRFSADGEFVEYEGLREPEGRPHFITALFEGVKRFPELEPVLPVRPQNAVTCPTCGGSGIVPSPFKCACGGLGWLPRDAG
jgi:hypothetical protein